MGTRNYIAVVAASNCAAHTAELIAQSFDDETLPPNIDGVVAFPHGEGCGHSIGPDTEQLQRTLAGVLAHPNVSAAVILGLGCEVNQIDHYLGAERAAFQPARGNDAAIERRHTGRFGGGAAIEIAALMEQGSAERRVEVPVSKIILGPELRRVGFVLRHHGQPGAGRLFGHAGTVRRVRPCWRRRPRSSAPSICWYVAPGIGK